MRISDWSSDVAALSRHGDHVAQHSHAALQFESNLTILADNEDLHRHDSSAILFGHPFAIGSTGDTVHPRLVVQIPAHRLRSEEHTSELQSLMRISYAVLCLKKKKKQN